MKRDEAVGSWSDASARGGDRGSHVPGKPVFIPIEVAHPVFPMFAETTAATEHRPVLMLAADSCDGAAHDAVGPEDLFGAVFQ